MFTNVTTSAYQDQLNAGFSKVCEIFKVRGIESLKYVRNTFHTPVWYCGDISTHRNVTLNETNCDWLFDMSVKWPHGRALANKCCHLFQIFSRQSEGLATRDYSCDNMPETWLGIVYHSCNSETASTFILVVTKGANQECFFTELAKDRNESPQAALSQRDNVNSYK